MSATKEQVRAYLAIIEAVANVIRELGSVPSGELYARMMPYMTFERYTQVVDTLKRAGVIKESGNVLTWAMPR